MSTIIWAETDWHCWTMPLTGYPVSESGDYTPEAGFHYQVNTRSHDRFSVLTDAGVAELMHDLQGNAKLMRWRLQHFTDHHVDKFLELLRLGALAEPDPSSVGLMMIAYRHWQQFDNLKIAQALVLHLLRAEYTHDELLDELYSEQNMRGEKRDKGFIRFVDNCEIVLQHERLLQQLKPKDVRETRKVKI